MPSHVFIIKLKCAFSTNKALDWPLHDLGVLVIHSLGFAYLGSFGTPHSLSRVESAKAHILALFQTLIRLTLKF